MHRVSLVPVMIVMMMHGVFFSRVIAMRRLSCLCIRRSVFGVRFPVFFRVLG